MCRIKSVSASAGVRPSGLASRLKCARDWEGVLEGLLEFEASARNETVQRFSAYVLHYEVLDVALLTEVVHGHDVRMT